MSDWFEDPWIEFTGKMMEDFFSYHNQTMPEDPENVWDLLELLYFCYSFTSYAAKLKFERKMSDNFCNREKQYQENIKNEMTYTVGSDDLEKSSFSEYK